MIEKNKKKLMFSMIFQICLNFGTCVKVGDDLHSSVTALQEILKTEKLLMENLDDYISGAELKIHFIKGFVEDLKDQHNHTVNESAFSPTIHDPIHGFRLKERLSFNVKNLKNFFNKTGERIVDKIENFQSDYEYPSKNDLEGVALGLLRVQEVYKIDAEQMANGELLDINFGAKFSAADCFQLGWQLQIMGFHFYSIGWLKAALKRLENETTIGSAPPIDRIRILDFLTYSEYSEGSLENAKSSVENSLIALGLQRILNMESYDHIAQNFKFFLEHYNDLKRGKKVAAVLDSPIGPLSRHNLTELDLLKKACRGELTKSPAEARNLYCKYETKNHPFLKLAPIKVEIVNVNPYVHIFHDVLYDSEIEIIKKYSTEHLVRAGVWIKEKGIGEPSQVRTSKFFWFRNHTDPVLDIINQRITDMTGLSMETSEPFQCMNYGVGGHYDIHPDYFPEPDAKTNTQSFVNVHHGNRIATVLFYMSDVQHGGATVFPYVKTAAFPKKGTAVFWYNLHADGEPDERSKHSACPIISGSKWVINRWIRSRSQEFRRPCKLYPDH